MERPCHPSACGFEDFEGGAEGPSQWSNSIKAGLCALFEKGCVVHHWDVVKFEGNSGEGVRGGNTAAKLMSDFEPLSFPLPGQLVFTPRWFNWDSSQNTEDCFKVLQYYCPPRIYNLCTNKSLIQTTAFVKSCNLVNLFFFFFSIKKRMFTSYKIFLNLCRSKNEVLLSWSQNMQY